MLASRWDFMPGGEISGHRQNPFQAARLINYSVPLARRSHMCLAAM
jgi:hypothetical protein